MHDLPLARVLFGKVREKNDLRYCLDVEPISFETLKGYIFAFLMPLHHPEDFQSKNICIKKSYLYMCWICYSLFIQTMEGSKIKDTVYSCLVNPRGILSHKLGRDLKGKSLGTALDFDIKHSSIALLTKICCAIGKQFMQLCLAINCDP